jgi:hypothetical protein
MTKTIRIVTTDFQVYQPEQLVTFLHLSAAEDSDVVIDIRLEGPCCSTIGLYKLLDNFCSATGFAKKRITIRTANLLEFHPEYKIYRDSSYWYEVQQIQQWLNVHQYNTGQHPSRHFGNFIGRSTWYRLWIASSLFKNHSDKTLQSFHSSFACNYVIPPSDGIFDTLELDYLNQFGCEDMLSVINFLSQCPMIISESNIATVQKIKTYIPVTNNNCYPLQHPANLMIEDFYNNIFVDIVCETKVMGQSLFLSEKTWRPMVARRPFILMSNLHALQNLRKLGFKTFNQWWDESYDDYSDQDRVREILKLLDFISQWSIEKCWEVLNEMQPVLNHNYQVFKELSYEKINRCLGIVNE